jgi:hypothetical protein
MKHSGRFPLVALAIIFCGSVLGLIPHASAEDRNALENSLFENSDTMVQQQTPSAMTEPADNKTVGFSGEITSAGVETRGNSLAALYAYTVADLYLDARLPQGAKVFANLEATLYGQTSSTDVALREMFLDFNVEHAVYLRAGKQVLQWGRCYLWNPTDLINIERRSFVTKIGNREGAYGVKAHVPFGTWLNLYSFLDTGMASDPDNTSAAFKMEWLIKNFEMAVSGWVKKNNHPVWGYDFSTRVLTVDIVGEASISKGQNHLVRVLNNGVLELSQDSEVWTPQACLDFSRKFQVGDFKDRLSINLEAYYNRNGYVENIFSDTTVYPYARPLPDSSGNAPVITAGTQLDFFQQNHLYQSNYHARYYAAMFTSFSRFLLTDMTLNCNYIHNCVDQSGTLTAGVTYTELNNLTLGLLGLAYVGGPDKEYTFSGQKYAVQATAALAF